VLPELLHRFSHFQLRITPVVFEFASAVAHVAEDGEQGWFLPGELGELGLPAPVRKLLANLAEESNPCVPSTA
jgi:A/G-specific adenine glycosylase